VHVRLGDRDPAQDRLRAGLRPFRERRAVDDPGEVLVTSMRRLLRLAGRDGEELAREIPPPDRLEREAALSRDEGLRERLEVLEPEARVAEVEQRGEQHVAGEARVRLEEE